MKKKLTLSEIKKEHKEAKKALSVLSISSEESVVKANSQDKGQDLDLAKINKTFRHWKFTYYGYTEETIEYLLSSEVKDRRYIKFGLEVCPETRRPHLQGWVWFNTPIRRQGAYKRIFRKNESKTNEGGYIEGLYGEEADLCDDMDDYVSKDGNTREAGTRKHQGKDTDLFYACEDLKDKTLDECIEKHTPQFAKHFNNLVNIKSSLLKKKAQRRYRPGACETVIIWGAPGGNGQLADGTWDTKTNYVYSKHGIENVYSVKQGNGNNVWFNNYSEEPVLLIDEFYGWIPFSKLMDLTDPMGYPCQLEVKGGSAWALWSKVYIISNKPPELWYSNVDKLQYGAFTRRIKETIYKGPESYKLKYIKPKAIEESDHSSSSDSDDDSFMEPVKIPAKKKKNSWDVMAPPILRKNTKYNG